MDEAFGKDTHLLDCIDGQTAYSYFAEVPKETRVWTSSPRPHLPASSGRGRKASKLVRPGEPTPLTVAQLADTFQEHEWQQHVLKEGSKGFIVASIACRRIVSVRNGSRFCSLAHRPPQSRLLSAILSLQCTP
ncbi:hypothetical protein KFU94_46490 [Chloroflexi bacterium TSY]|nr:hypothetical protein [Chloroflexi bacterium TSY]